MATLANLVVKVTGDSSSMERTMDRASRKMRSFSRDAERLLSSRLTQALSLGALTLGMKKAFDAADRFDASQRKLASTAKITGQNLGFLQVTAQRANQQFRLGATLSNEFAIEVSKLTSKAGQIEQTGAAIGALLNLGAARGYGAADTLQAVQQAILGIDEGTDKLFGKNPSVIYAEFAQKVGISVAKMNDGQKAMAILNAAMDDGGKVATAYAEFLKSPAGQAEQLRIRIEEAAAGIGRSMNGLRTAAIPILGELVDGFAKAIGGIRVLWVDLKETWALAKEFATGGGSSLSDAMTGKGGNGAMAKIRQQFQEERLAIVREIELASTISGPTNPLANMFTEAATAASSLANVLDDRVDGALRRLSLRAPNRGIGNLAVPGSGGAPQAGGITSNMPAGAASGRSVSERFAGQGGGAGMNLGGLMSGLGGSIMGVISAFNPLTIVSTALGQILAGPLSKAISYVTEGFGWLIRAIGKAVNFLLPGNPANGLVTFGQSMMDQAKAARKATDATATFAETLTNVANVIHINALRHRVAGGMAPPAGTPTTQPPPYVRPRKRPPGGYDHGDPGGQGESNVVIAGPVYIQANSMEEFGRQIERRYNRGGTWRGSTL